MHSQLHPGNRSSAEREREKEKNKIAPTKSRDRSGEARHGGLKVEEEGLTNYSNFFYIVDFHSYELHGTGKIVL